MKLDIERYAARFKMPVVLYVDVYPYTWNGNELRFLCLKRRHDVALAGQWQAVSGKMAEGRSISESFLDQVMKKTGFAPTTILPLQRVTTYYSVEYDRVMMVPAAAARIDSSSIEVDRTLHCEYAWKCVADAERLLPFQTQKTAVREISECLLANGGGEAGIVSI